MPHPPIPKASKQNLHSPSTHPRPNLPQTLTHPQNPINHQPIRRALYLEVAKKRVRAEQAENLVQRIVALRVRLGRQV